MPLSSLWLPELIFSWRFLFTKNVFSISNLPFLFLRTMYVLRVVRHLFLLSANNWCLRVSQHTALQFPHGSPLQWKQQSVSVKRSDMLESSLTYSAVLFGRNSVFCWLAELYQFSEILYFVSCWIICICSSSCSILFFGFLLDCSAFSQPFIQLPVASCLTWLFILLTVITQCILCSSLKTCFSEWSPLVP